MSRLSYYTTTFVWLFALLFMVMLAWAGLVSMFLPPPEEFIAGARSAAPLVAFFAAVTALLLTLAFYLNERKGEE